MNLLQLNFRHQSPQKGVKGKILICIFIVCIEKQTKNSQDKAVKITHWKIYITFTIIFCRKPWIKLVWHCQKLVLSASISGCLSSAQLPSPFLLSFLCISVKCFIVLPFCFPQISSVWSLDCTHLCLDMANCSWHFQSPRVSPVLIKTSY